MSLDAKIVEAVRTATREAGQPDALARRLVAWLEAVADGSADIADVAAADRYLEVIYEAVSLGGDATGAAAEDDTDDGADDEGDREGPGEAA